MGEDEAAAAVKPDGSAQALAVHSERATAWLPVLMVGGCVGTTLFALRQRVRA